MAADYAGAVAAIRAKFVAEWVDGASPRSRIAFVNETPADPWPPVDGDGQLENWVLLEIEAAGQAHVGFGTPGNRVYAYDGSICIHAYVPVGEGVADATALAALAGEIFREKVFYNDVTAGCYVRSTAPSVDGGGPGDESGAWYRVSAVIPFEYWHRA